ncbi:MAG: ATP-binding cassette domain-containing protein [Clostridia bacterium]|nr:ATP-binding cassette domain-containing protein [Clostridia bacterium]
MLEVRHLTKIYKDKGGAELKALDDITLKFGDTGMVFILGKSGCGKSTFLNIVGGLDSPTSGEVIVNGRSSKDFSQADFDSYRNTYIGFVFQEYNVLGEFTVEDNVALALELQSQKQVKDKVAEILREVDLQDFAKRKPNTLSGGQKQRIAIARALVKDPQIIMADEPTGALDSNTGRQVLDTLKSLSKTRLVIVVSHDRDFAEEYGDRIIELSDGRIISDITKVHEQPVEVSSNVKQIGAEILSIDDGSQLTADNYEAIRAFLSSQGSVMIVSGDAEIRNTKAANRIAEDNSRESFVRTDEAAGLSQDEAGAGKEDRLIRSRLPIGKAIKMGASSLKGHPVRLVFTILLSLVAFVVFGLLSCFMMYNGNTVAASTFASGDEEYLTLEKSYAKYYTYTYYQQNNKQETEIKFGDSYFNSDDAAYFGMDASEALYGCSYRSSFRSASLDSDLSGCTYYSLAGISKAMYVPEGNILRNDMIGTYPASDDEIAVSTYLADYLLHCTVYSYEYNDDSQSMEEAATVPESYEDLIGLSVDDFKITGVIDTGETPSKYDYMKEGYAEEKDYSNFEAYLQDGIQEAIFVTPEFISENTDITEAGESYSDYMYSRFAVTDTTLFMDVGNVSGDDMVGSQSTRMANTYDESRSSTIPAVFISGHDSHTLASDEIILGLNDLYSLIMTQYYNESRSYTGSDFDSTDLYRDYNGYTDQDGTEVPGIHDAIDAYRNGYYTGDSGSRVYLTDDEMSATGDFISAYLTKHALEITISQYTSGWGSLVKAGTFKVVGFYYTDMMGRNSNNGIYIPDSAYNTSIRLDYSLNIEIYYERPSDAFYEYMAIPVQKDQSWAKKLMNSLYTLDEATTLYYSLDNNLYEDIEYANEMVATLSIVFLVAGIVFAVFAALLLFNFISVSITSKNKEIGILRAVGAKSSDVFKIFFSESAIIALICFVLAVIITGIFAACANSLLFSLFGMMVNIVVFTPVCVVMMLAIAVIVAFLGTFIPVYMTAKKKPVEAIRSL